MDKQTKTLDSKVIKELKAAFTEEVFQRLQQNLEKSSVSNWKKKIKIVATCLNSPAFAKSRLYR